MFRSLLLLSVVFAFNFVNCREVARDSRNEEVQARVSHVADGDSFTIKREGKDVRVRINAVDAPELAQEFGKESRNNLTRLIANRDVLLVPKTYDKYGRMVADVFVGDKNVGLAQIEDGFAWDFRPNKNFVMPDGYEAAENRAKKESKGLWKSANPTPPWDWRKQNPRNN